MIKKIILPIIFTLLTAVVSLLLVDRFITGVELPRLSFFSKRSEAAYTIEEEIDDIYLLNTSEYTLKLIFPHDFVDRDLNWWYIKEMHEREIEVDDDLKPLHEIYRYCLSSGFDPAVETYEFVILTAVVKAGIPLDQTPFDEGRLDDLVRIEENEKGRVITLDLPETEITQLHIDDRKPAADNFPDAEMTPAQWRDLVTFLTPLIEERVVALGILDDAAENSRELLEKILLDSDFDEVRFTESSL